MLPGDASFPGRNSLLKVELCIQSWRTWLGEVQQISEALIVVLVNGEDGARV